MAEIVKSRVKGVRWVSDKEMAKIVDKRARATLKVSGTVFMRNQRNGKYRNMDAGKCPGVVELALIAPTRQTRNVRGGKKS